MPAASLRRRRALPIIALAAVAFLAGAIAGASHSSSGARTLAASFVSAWTRADYGAMYLDLDLASQRSTSPRAFADAYRSALTTATATRLQVAGRPRRTTVGYAVPVRVHTRLFGTLPLLFDLPISSSGGHDGVRWTRSLEFPGLHAGEVLGRRTTLPTRATLLARDDSVLAEGSATGAGQRSSPLGPAVSAVVGDVGPVPPERRRALEAQGVPATAIVGVSGLELALDDRLRGTPGGELLAEPAARRHARRAGPSGEAAGPAGGRVLASARPLPARPVRTSISPVLQRAAAVALGGQYGGIVAMQPSSGQILAVAGIGLDSVQPPGSTFKMVTVSSVLEAAIATPRTSFPFATYTTLDGVRLDNANGEECGGTLEQAFAVSCNSVFAPLGVKLGAPRLVAMAERYGFNHSPSIEGAAESTIPAAARIQGELDLGSTAIGQGQVQASALQMATVAATIADGGHRPTPTVTFPATAAPGPPATSATVAHIVRRLMIGVVRDGTGTSAAIPGVVVAGKTGTAELHSETECPSSAPEGKSDPPGGAPDPPPSDPPGATADPPGDPPGTTSDPPGGTPAPAGGATGPTEGAISSGASAGAASGASEATTTSGEAESHTAGGQESGAAGCRRASSEASNTDAWFAAFAPALHPRVALAVLLVKDGAGGDTAAPVAREVLEAGLSRGR